MFPIESLADYTIDLAAEQLEKLKEFSQLAVPEKPLELYNTPTIEFIDAGDQVSADAVLPGNEGFEITNKNTATPAGVECEAQDVFENIQTVTTVVGVDCEAGGIQVTEKTVQLLDAQGAQLEPEHELHDALEAYRAGDTKTFHKESREFAEKLNLLRDENTYTNESALLQDHDMMVVNDDGSVVLISGETGETMASVDCDGNITKFEGPWIDSGDCVTCDPEPESPAVEAPPIVEQPAGPKVQTVEVCAAPGVCEVFESTLIFESIEQAQEYFSHPGNVNNFPENYQDSLDPDFRFFVIADGEEYLECLPYEIRGDEIQLKTEKMFPLQMYGDIEKDYDFRSHSYTYERAAVGDMTGPVGKEYFNGYVGIEGDTKTGGLEFDMTKGETLFPSAPQEFVYNPETGAHEYESFEDSVNRTFGVWVTEAGLTGSEWNQINDMPLPEEFANPNTSVIDRATALKEAAAERGVVLTQENAEELTRIINEGAFGEDGGLNFNEKNITANNFHVLARTNGEMARLDSALISASQNITRVLRDEQGFAETLK